MRKLAEFIVDKRKFLLIIFIAAAIGSVIMSSHINVIQELTDYLPDDTETSIGLDVMDEQFTTFGTAKVMVQNVTYDQAKAIADQLKDIKGVSAVDFYEEDEDDENNDTEEKEFTNSEDMRDSYQDLAALYSISFETPEDDSLAQAAIADVRTALKDYDAWFYTTVDKDDAADLQDESHSGNRGHHYCRCFVVYVRYLYGDCHFHAGIWYGSTPEYGNKLYLL